MFDCILYYFIAFNAGACRWSDGSPVNFLYWDQFKQNSDREDCVEMMLDKEGKWNRRLCQEPLAYVCSKDKGWSGNVHNSCEPMYVVLSTFNSAALYPWNLRIDEVNLLSLK